MSRGDVEGRLFRADGVTPVRFERDGGELRNVDAITLAPGDFLDLGAVPGTFTLTLEALPVDPGIVEWFYGGPDERGPIDGL